LTNERGQDVTTKYGRRFAVAATSLAAAAAMAVTLIHPAAAQTHTDRTTHAPANLPPLPTYHGAIAVAPDGSVGKAWRHKSKALAKQRALTLCGADTCTVVSSFTRCGAVAHDGATYRGGVGTTRSVAEANAVTKLGGGWIVTWACNL
jgi:Domain of unknown function (DUF4189)